MNFCELPIVLNIFMYFKYIFLIILLFILIYNHFNKDNKISDKILKITIIINVVYYLLFAITYFLNVSLKYCFLNSNPSKIYLNNRLSKTYNSDNIYYSYDQFSGLSKPTQKINVKDKNYNLFLYNVNYYPLNDILFNFNESNESFSLNKSGNEIAVLASVISSLESEETVDPIQIIEKIKYNDNLDKSNLNMDNLLSSLYNEYRYEYTEIDVSQIEASLRRSGLVIVKVHGASKGEIFTCTESYIIIYNVDNEYNYYVADVNDKPYDTICPVGTQGFGNIKKANINDNVHFYDDIKNNSEKVYVLWR